MKSSVYLGALLLVAIAGSHATQAAASSNRKLLEDPVTDAIPGSSVQAAAAAGLSKLPIDLSKLPLDPSKLPVDPSTLAPAAAKLLECLQQDVIKAALVKGATRAQRKAAGAAAAQCYKDNAVALNLPTAAAASGEVSSSSAAADKTKWDGLSAAVNALLPARLLVSAVDSLTRNKELEVAKQVLQLFVANTGCGKDLLAALTPFNQQALKAVLTAAMKDQTALGSCKAEDVPPLLLALAASYCPNNDYVTCKPEKNSYTMFEKRQGALLAAATSTALLRADKAAGIALGRTVFRMALAVSQTTSAAACKTELPAFLAAIPADGTNSITDTGLNLLCNTVKLLSPATGTWQPSTLLQAGCIDPINAAALQLKSTYKSMPKQLQAQTEFYCSAWKDTLTFGTTGSSVSLFSSAPAGFRCLLEGGAAAACASPLPFGFTKEPELDATHDLSYTVDASGAVTSIFPCP